jgi:type IV secretion system protein VirD4
MLIFVAGYPPIYGTQILYFKDDVFLARAQVPAPKTDRLAQEKQTKTAAETAKRITLD